MTEAKRSEGKRPVTGADVARIAGVSQATVSLVVTGKSEGRISDEQRDHVLKIARGLSYQPNASARSLRLGRARTIALIVPNVANPYFSSVLLGAERAARERDHAVMLLDTGSDPDWPGWVGGILATRAADGCIVYAADPLTPGRSGSSARTSSSSKRTPAAPEASSSTSPAGSARRWST